MDNNFLSTIRKQNFLGRSSIWLLYNDIDWDDNMVILHSIMSFPWLWHALLRTHFYLRYSCQHCAEVQHVVLRCDHWYLRIINQQMVSHHDTRDHKIVTVCMLESKTWHGICVLWISNQDRPFIPKCNYFFDQVHVANFVMYSTG